MSGATRVFVKRTKTKAAKKDRWPVRETGKKDEKKLVELPTTRPAGSSAVGQLCLDDAEALKFIHQKEGRVLWKELGMGVAEGSFVENGDELIFDGTSFKFYQNILKEDVVNLVFDFDDTAPNHQAAMTQQQNIIDWFKQTVMEKLKLTAAKADELIAISHCTRPDPKSYQACLAAEEHLEK